MKKIIIFCVLNLITLATFAQYTLEPTHFGKEFSQQLGYTGDLRKDGASMTREFLAFWQSDSINNEQRDQFIKSINLLQSKGCKAFPDFVRFTDNLMIFIRKGYDYDQYLSYTTAIQKMIEKGRKIRVTEVSEFLQTMNNMLRGGIICRNQRNYWKVNNVDFLITFENDKLLINIDNIDLIAYQNKDSLKIYRTSGIYDPIAKTWDGKGGQLGWERVGYSLDSMSVKLDKYHLNLTDVNLKADSVVLQNKYYFKESLMGELLDKVQNIEDLKKSTYPRFTSYSQDFDIKEIVKNVDYKGGFSVRGRNFIGAGTEDKKAEIRIERNDTTSFSAYANAFVFDPEKIVSDNCEIVLRLGSDSIYHPSVTMRYTIVKRAFEKEGQETGRKGRKQTVEYDIKENGYLEVVRTKEGLSNLNFFDSYHQLSMDFTCMKWIIDKPTIVFSTINTQGTPSEVIFESADYYTYAKYKSIKKQDAIHPLEVLANFVSSWAGYPEFYIEDLAKYMKYGHEQILQWVYALEYKGYLTYDPHTQYVKIKPETWKFLDAHRGTIDSDVILFYSKVKTAEGVAVDNDTRTVIQNSFGNDTTANAKLSLINFDLKMDGVPFVHLSDSQNVMVYPKDQKLVIQKNRNFVFDGLVQAGQFYMYGSNFKFDYNRFLIEMPSCDSMKMVAQTLPEMGFLDSNGEPKNAIVRNKLSGIRGTFYIDDPQNKSGRIRFEEYPTLNSEEKTYVYFDLPEIYNGIYERDRMYFSVEPFKIDSIKGFDKDNIKFKGTLFSGGIFPDINETLIVRESDWSLGFEHQTPASGLPIYDGRAKFKNTIDLSNKGLRGNGTIDYLTTTFSDSYVTFFPDNMEGHSKIMNTRPADAPVEFPEVLGVENTLAWEIPEDKFVVEKDTANFNLYGGQAFLDGTLTLRSTGMIGKGNTYIEKAKFESEEYKYSREYFDADTSNFKFYTKDITDIDFESKNVHSHIDFKERKGDFVSNGESSIQTFPKNKYECTSDHTIWYMDEDNFAFKADQEVMDKLATMNPEDDWEKWESIFVGSSKFTSIYPGQDRLEFYAPEALYNYNDYIITASGVGVIRVADAAVFPGDKKVIIYRDAVMDTLRNANILANVTSEYYKFYNSTVKIKGKKKYDANGYYDYKNETEVPQTIFFDKIGIERESTIASGEIIQDQNFKITQHFGFQGNVKAYAAIDSLEYTGSTNIAYECDTNYTWFKFKSFVSPESPFIPIDSVVRSINNVPLVAGIMLSNTKVYPAFLSRKIGSYDHSLLSSRGYLYYSEEDNQYQISSMEKLYEHNLPGDFLAIDRETCDIYGEGKINFSNDFNTFKLNSYGSVTYPRESDTAIFSVTMLADFYTNNQANEEFAKVINSTSPMPFDRNDDIYHLALKQYLGTEMYDKLLQHISFGNYDKFPKEIVEGKIILTGMDFRYYKEENAFIYYGPIGIANAGKSQINKMVSGCVKITKSRSGDKFEMLLEPDMDNWFYFKFAKNTMLMCSSDNKFNDIIINTKAKDATTFIDGKPYSYSYGGQTDKNKFKKDMDNKFLNSEEYGY